VREPRLEESSPCPPVKLIRRRFIRRPFFCGDGGRRVPSPQASASIIFISLASTSRSSSPILTRRRPRHRGFQARRSGGKASSPLSATKERKEEERAKLKNVTKAHFPFPSSFAP